MATGVDDQELVDRFEEFFRSYCHDEIGRLARNYPSEQRSLYVDWQDLFRFDTDLADDFLDRPEQLQRCAEEALRMYDLPVDVKLGQAHVRIRNLPETTPIRDIRARHVNTLISVSGIVRKATDVRPKVQNAAFQCQRCESLTQVPQTGGDFQEPHECRSCERQGPFRLNFDQSEFVDAQRLRVQESPEGLRGGETPQSIDVNIEDDITGEVTPGDRVTATGVLRLDQSGDGDSSPVFDVHMEGVSVELEDEEFEDMDITEEDKREIVELSNEADLYERMVDAMAPTIHGYREEKLAMVLQLFSGVTKNLPDGSRIRGDLHMLLIGDPGTGKCVSGDTRVTLADGTEVPIKELVEANLDDPKPVDDGVYDEVDIELPSMTPSGRLVTGTATKVWKRETPEQLYRIQTAAGAELEVTPSHPLFVPGTPLEARTADSLHVGDRIVRSSVAGAGSAVRADGGTIVQSADCPITLGTGLEWDEITSIEAVDPDDEWVYDLEVAGTHSYLSNGIVSHNSQMLQYIRNIAPRSVYTSGKGSSSAGLTAAAVRDDFGDGQQWTLEAGALVLADQGVAAVDELDKMRCVTGDTLVHLGDGRITKIRDLAIEAAESGEIEELPNGRTIRDIDCRAWTMDSEGKIVTRPVTAIHEYEAPENLTQITLESGETVTTTHDHPFFVLEDGKRVRQPAEELSAGDWAYVPRCVPTQKADGGVVTTEKDTSNLQSGDTGAFGAVLGYLSGDGNIYYDRDEGVYGIRFTNKEDELRADFERACREAFDASPYRAESEQREDGVETVRLSGKKYADAVLEGGMTLGRYDKKAFPKGVTEQDRTTKAKFVRALAESEGTVDKQTGNIRITSASLELLTGVKTLLLEFGVSSQIRSTQRAEKRDIYNLAITDADALSAYRQHIGFTLDRKRRALDEVCEAADGGRTIRNVVPEVEHILRDCRKSLRLHVSECGIDDVTYCDFEQGKANIPIHRARRVLESFENRKSSAERDIEKLQTDRSWQEISDYKETYHVSQSELAEGTEYTQQRISRQWGEDEQLKTTVKNRLTEIISSVATTDISRLRELVRADVTWRKVDKVESSADVESDRYVEILRNDLADVICCNPTNAVERGQELLANDPSADSWEALQEEMERYGISFQQLSDRLGVAGSTVSRWFNGVGETDRFDEVRTVAVDEIDSKKETIQQLIDEINQRNRTKVYDLTVEGTHNFIANGMVIHNSEDRSAMHEALEQQSISVSKAGINATLKSRCSLLGAANPKYGRFDQYEPIGEQIDLEPALISRFDLIFTVTDQPDEQEDAALAEHILTANYAGELNTQREEMASPDITHDQVESIQEDVEPAIEPELLRKYVAYAQQNCHPRMSEGAREEIRDFYVNLRSKGADEDAPVPVTARKLEALVRLAEASARVRLSDEVTREDANRVIDIVRSCLQDIGVDPETGQFDADVVETGQSKTQRDRKKNIRALIEELENEYDEGVPVDEVVEQAEEIGLERDKAESEVEKLKQKGEVYEPRTGHVRTT